MPDITSARPSSGSPVATAWGDEVHDQLEGIQAGTAVVPAGSGASGYSVAVVFPRAYIAPPAVVVTYFLHNGFYAVLSAPPTATGFTFVVASRTGSAASIAAGSAGWVAIGTPA